MEFLSIGILDYFESRTKCQVITCDYMYDDLMTTNNYISIALYG